MNNGRSEFSHDTRPLDPGRLSREELFAIYEIEARLKDPRFTKLTAELDGRDKYLATTQVRHPRVLLLDGGRGTGKTSLLLTLVERWKWETETDFKKKQHAYLRALEDIALKVPDDKARDVKTALVDIPRHISVVDILDFDPLPAQMPIAAGVVQALRPLAEHYDKLANRDEDCEATETLTDKWSKLLQMAAIGGSALPGGKGLVEQVLDREEQVRDWLEFEQKWQDFVTALIKESLCYDEEKGLGKDPVLVIMIDDCDLQVERIGQLLPALRTLYHPRLFFIVAADRPHMVDMLTLDYLGRQNRLANCQGRGETDGEQESDWPKKLADAAFEKVFPIRNRWQLDKLSLDELLDFSVAGVSFVRLLEGWTQKKAHPSAFASLGAYLKAMADTRGDPNDVPPTWSYRTAHQILENVIGRQHDRLSVTGRGESAEAVYGVDDAVEVIGRLLGRSEYDDLVHIRKTATEAAPETPIERKFFAPEAPPGEAPAPEDGEIEAMPPSGTKTDVAMDFLQQGELEAYFHPDLFEDISQSGRIMLSARPHFRYYDGLRSGRAPDAAKEDRQSSVRKTSAILAVSMQEDGFRVSTPRLLWDARLTLVWTAINLADHDLALAWPWYRHPSPLRLLSWARDWRRFITGLRQKTAQRPDRIAYAWIYYQLQWMTDEGLTRTFDAVAEPLDTHLTKEEWDALLRVEPVHDEKEDAPDLWLKRTLPLLARPELGLTPAVQDRLLEGVREGSPEEKRWLKGERRRLITDSILNAAEEGHRPLPEDANRSGTVESIIQSAKDRYVEINEGDESKWSKIAPWDEATGDKPGLQPKGGKDKAK